MRIKRVKEAIGRFHALMSYEPHKSLMLSAITSGGGGEWILQLLLQMAFEDVVGDTHFVRREFGPQKLDIACIDCDTRGVDVAIEVKAPFTNRGGINSKITDRKNTGIAKDIESLRTYVDAGASLGLEIVLVVELFMKGEDNLYAGGQTMTRKKFENLARELWEMKYPTLQDYDPRKCQSDIDAHPVMTSLKPLTDWNRTDFRENEFGGVSIRDRCYRLKRKATR